jgi:broad specificity phosphatase PhoE
MSPSGSSEHATPSTLWLIRHGETAWSRSGAHTGRTDIELTEGGREMAVRLGTWLDGREFRLVLSSPRRRARDTCALAGYGRVAEIDADLREWDYGEYEGLSTPEIRSRHPEWDLWRDGVPGGESIAQVAERAARIIARSLAAGGEVALFGHGHLLRVLTAVWMEMPPEAGRRLALDTASVSTLGFERETRVIRTWNRGFV